MLPKKRTRFLALFGTTKYKIKKAGKNLNKKGILCFVQLGADTTDLEEEAAIQHCQEENEKAIDAIRTALSK